MAARSDTETCLMACPGKHCAKSKVLKPLGVLIGGWLCRDSAEHCSENIRRKCHRLDESDTGRV
jgi:hypothetical protein